MVETRQPDPDDALGWNDRDYARIDLVVEVPAGVATAIEHGAGTVSVIGVGPLRVKDGAGDVEALDVGGEVRIEDGSGAVRVHRVRGNVVVEGGTGALEVSEVEGALTVTGSEGEVRIRDVTGGVTVPGDVEVRLLERGAVEAGRPGEGGGA